MDAGIRSSQWILVLFMIIDMSCGRHFTSCIAQGFRHRYTVFMLVFQERPSDAAFLA